MIDHRLTRLEAADLAANFGDNLRFNSTAPQANQETEGNINNVFNSSNVPSREAMILVDSVPRQPRGDNSIT